MPLPFPDALQEFKAETSARPAEYGFHATATVNAVTKSGTNDFHGDLFEFVGIGDLNARDAFALKRDTLKRNQFGTYGNFGRNNMKGPGVFQLDMALSRNFKFKEGQTIQLPAEAFNLPNHLNPFAPGVVPNGGQTGAFVNVTAPNFGQITNDISGTNGLTASDYRVIQLAMKLIF